MGYLNQRTRGLKALCRGVQCALLTVILASSATVAHAQRRTDQLDRGLVAVKNNAGVFLSWRILGEEYYDVTYNVYRNGTKINGSPLTVSNYVDNGGTLANT